MYHELKCLPQYFQPLVDSAKMFEVRQNDRPFRVGDILVINEYVPESLDPYDDTVLRNKTDDWREVKDGYYTGRSTIRRITYILDDKTYCVEGMIILGLGFV